MLLIELGIGHHRHEHLRRALTVSDVSYLLLSRNLHDPLPKSRLVIETHFVETVVEKLLSLALYVGIDIPITFLRLLNVQKTVLLRVLIPSRIVKPHIKSGINQSGPNRILLVYQPAHHRIIPPVLTNDYRFSLNLKLPIRSRLRHFLQIAEKTAARSCF